MAVYPCYVRRLDSLTNLKVNMEELSSRRLQRFTARPEVKNKVFKIETILTRKRPGSRNFIYVKWLGWPSKFNSWIPEKDVVDV